MFLLFFITHKSYFLSDSVRVRVAGLALGKTRLNKTLPDGEQKPARPDECVSIGSWVVVM